jgi:hypothetical protein
VLPGGATARFEFSLAFATVPALPGIAFITCQQRHPPELFWKPDYQCHPNGALRVVEVVMSAPEPAAHRSFLECFQVNVGVLSTPPAASHGLTLEFVEQGIV